MQICFPFGIERRKRIGMILEKEAVEQLIQQGATLAELASQQNLSWDDAAAKLTELGIARPGMVRQTAADQTIAQYQGLIDGMDIHPTPEQLVLGPDGHVIELPVNFSTSRIDLSAVFERFHGKDGWVDPFNGQPTGPVDENGQPTRFNGRIVVVNNSVQNPGRPRNFLITNVETLTDQTVDQRFCRWMAPIREEFVFRDIAKKWDIGLVISRNYDRTIGGTYNPIYMDNLFDRWVRQPLNQYYEDAVTSPEKEPVFRLSAPFELAWWVWQQLTHAGLLKGLIELAVSSHDGRTSVLRDEDVMGAVLGYHLKDHSASSLIVTPDQIPNQKFSPGALLR